MPSDRERPTGSSIPPADSIDLLRVGQRGDGAAVNELFRRYQPRLLRVVRAKMDQGLRRHVDPDDVVQETCIIAVEKLPGFELRSDATILGWLARIAELVMQNKRRGLLAQKRDPRREVPAVDAGETRDGVVLPSPGPTPSQEFSLHEVEEKIDACIAEVQPTAYREVLVLRQLCGQDWEAIRQELDRPSVEAVQELYRRAKEKLTERLIQAGLG